MSTSNRVGPGKRIEGKFGAQHGCPGRRAGGRERRDAPGHCAEEVEEEEEREKRGRNETKRNGGA